MSAACHNVDCERAATQRPLFCKASTQSTSGFTAGPAPAAKVLRCRALARQRPPPIGCSPTKSLDPLEGHSPMRPRRPRQGLKCAAAQLARGRETGQACPAKVTPPPWDRSTRPCCLRVAACSLTYLSYCVVEESSELCCTFPEESGAHAPHRTRLCAVPFLPLNPSSNVWYCTHWLCMVG